jgi:hypothetical protein
MGCAAAQREAGIPPEYQLSGRRQDGIPATIAVRRGRWAEIAHVAAGVDERLVVESARVVRYGIYGDVYVGDPETTAGYEARTQLLTQTLGPAHSGASANGAVYLAAGRRPVYVSRRGGEIATAHIEGFRTYTVIEAEGGVITKWRSLEGDGFEGERVAGPVSEDAFAEPGAPSFHDGDPSVAKVGLRSIKVLVDTGTSGFAVSAQLAREAGQLGVSVPVRSSIGLVREPLVRLSSFSQLGVVRRSQVARVTAAIPTGYDAVEGVGMLAGLVLHFGAQRHVHADRRACVTGLPYSIWNGTVQTLVSSSERGFGGVTTIDTGHVGTPIQRTSPLAMLGLERTGRYAPRTVAGSVRPYTALCARHAVEFLLGNIGTVRRPVCYVPDYAYFTPGFFAGPTSELFVEPVSFIGGTTTIDTVRNLICRND